MRAIYEWCADQGFTPYIQVVVDGRARVPREYVRDGQIVLNIGMEATHQLNIGNEEITFQARFNGKAFPIYVPVDCVAAIYARENGQGMAFDVAPQAGEDEAPAQEVVVDADEGEAAVEAPVEAPIEASESSLTDVPKPAAGENKPRSHLTRVK